MIKDTAMESDEVGIWIRTPNTCQMCALGESLNFSKPKFPNVQKGVTYTYLQRGVLKIMLASGPEST